jgi:succinoglycan biosynthesis protein ExoO
VTLSVIVAAYNAERFLERAVASLLASSRVPDEVLIVDDASDDGTLPLIRRLEKHHRQVRGLAVPVNSGPAHARNVALDAATGTWVAVHDADDAVTPGRFEAMIRLAEEQSADVVLDNFVFVNASTGSQRPSRIPGGGGWERMDLHQFLRGARAFNYQPTWALLKPLLRREFLNQHQVRYPADSRHGEDYLLMVELFLAGASMLRMRDAGYLYTERTGGFSTTRIDYALMIEHTRALQRDPRLADDGRAQRLLRRRISTIQCLEAEAAGPVPLARAALSPGVAATLARRVGRRATRVARRTAPDPLPGLL